MARLRPIHRTLDFLASVRLAIPLLVLISLATIVGSVIPQGRDVGLADDLPAWVHRANAYLQLNDLFHSAWFLSLLGMLGICLLAISVKRVPMISRERGAGAGAGVFLAHLGALIILGGAIYGARSGFRDYVRLVEGEAAVPPELPFVIELVQLDVRYHSPESFRHRGEGTLVPERQDSRLSFYHHGGEFLTGTAAPGYPLSVRGVTLLPARKDVGWAFDLLVNAPNGKSKVVPVHPWSPALIVLGWGNTSRILAHHLRMEGRQPRYTLADDPASMTTEIFLLNEDGTHHSLGRASTAQPLEYAGWRFSVVRPRRYTGMHIYTRPEQPILLGGIAILVTGLLGYFTEWGAKLLPNRRRSERETAHDVAAS